MNNVANSRSSPSSEPPAWLGELYEHRRRRTVSVVELSIAALARAGVRTSLGAIARISKTVDLADPNGISESAILHNEEAYALYRQNAEHKRRTPPSQSAQPRTTLPSNNRIRASADRDRGRARQRHLRASKADLVERLLIAEQAYAEVEHRWLQTADELLIWIMLVDRLIANPRARGSSR